MDKRIADKKRYARKLLPIKGNSENKEKLNLIYKQIVCCEELFRPLSEADIYNMCQLDNDVQIENYAREIKFA